MEQLDLARIEMGLYKSVDFRAQEEKLHLLGHHNGLRRDKR